MNSVQNLECESGYPQGTAKRHCEEGKARRSNPEKTLKTKYKKLDCHARTKVLARNDRKINKKQKKG